MNLDLHTLGIIGMAVGVAISFSFTLFMMVLRELPALRIWSVGFWVLTLGALLEGLGESTSLLWTLVGNGLIGLANALMLMGIAVHVRFPLRWRWPLLFVATYVCVQGVELLTRPGIATQGLVFALHSVIWDVWMVWVLLRRAPADQRNTCGFTAAVFIVDLLFYAARGLFLLLPSVAGHERLLQWLISSNDIFGILCTFLLSTGFILMLAQRLTLDLRRLAQTDELTGLLNRAALMEHGKLLVEQCRQQMRPCCVLMFDLDRFKAINDHWGHAAGDAVLKHFAVVVHSVGLPKQALFARHGGEEFLLVLPGVTPGQAAKLAEEMRLRIALRPASFEGHEIAVTTSIGLTATAVNTGFEDMVRAADAALYWAKERGRNRVEWDYARDQVQTEGDTGMSDGVLLPL